MLTPSYLLCIFGDIDGYQRKVCVTVFHVFTDISNSLVYKIILLEGKKVCMYTVRNEEENQILHEILRVVSRFPHYTFHVISRSVDYQHNVQSRHE